jgi:hypothetical protein
MRGFKRSRQIATRIKGVKHSAFAGLDFASVALPRKVGLVGHGVALRVYPAGRRDPEKFVLSAILYAFCFLVFTLDD